MGARAQDGFVQHNGLRPCEWLISVSWCGPAAPGRTAEPGGSCQPLPDRASSLTREEPPVKA
jgi:hypothetical protein